MRTDMVKKGAVAAAVIVLIIAYNVLGLDRYFTLSALKESQKQFAHLYSENPAAVVGAYMGVYIVVAALSLPGAAVMTLAGGALFGLAVGTIAVSFASTIGATLAFLVSRLLLRDWVRQRLGKQIEKINSGIRREGAFYLFTLRLIPVFPFWMINLAMGLTEMSAGTFYWVSQVGMLPGTLVYVNAGKELADIRSVSDVMSPGLIASFLLLGLFPLCGKKAIAWYRKKTGKTIQLQS